MKKTLAVELGGSRIRVNAIAPGLVDTRFAAALLGNKDILDRVNSRTPIGRPATPYDIGGAAVFGSTCLRMTRPAPAPSARAPVT